ERGRRGRGQAVARHQGRRGEEHQHHRARELRHSTGAVEERPATVDVTVGTYSRLSAFRDQPSSVSAGNRRVYSTSPMPALTLNGTLITRRPCHTSNSIV